MAKLLISASDLREIIERDPEIHAELIRSASEQVAETIARRITNEQVATHVEHCMRTLVEERTGYGDRKLAAPFMGLIESEAKRAVAAALSAGLSQVVRAQIAQEVQQLMPQIAQQLTQELKQNLKDLMKEQLVELLLTRS
jgi:ribonucleotide reductase beta subunit family protein with ferritin-like domain